MLFIGGPQSQEKEHVGLYKGVDLASEFLFVLLFSMQGCFDVSCIWFLIA